MSVTEVPIRFPNARKSGPGCSSPAPVPVITVTERARRYIAKCPPAISGQHGHDATFRVAAVLWNGFGLSETDTLALLSEYNQHCVPPWSEAELVHKVKSAANAQHAEPRGHLLGKVEGRELRVEGGGRGKSATSPFPLPSAERASKPVFCPMVLKRVAAKTAGVRDVVTFLAERSPVPVEGLTCGGFLRRLYPAPGISAPSPDHPHILPGASLRRGKAEGPGEKVLLFSRMQSQGQLLWKADACDLVPDEHFPAGPDGVWFLAQPVDGEFHPNPRLGGKPSRRSEESVTAWRYVVLESDQADADDWLRCLIQMPLQIASICESGGRSIHALVRLDAASKPDWDTKVRAIKPVLVTLGADPGALSAVRLTRLPQAKRGERVQRLLYLDPAPDGKPIMRVRNAECGVRNGKRAECGMQNGGTRND